VLCIVLLLRKTSCVASINAVSMFAAPRTSCDLKG